VRNTRASRALALAGALLLGLPLAAAAAGEATVVYRGATIHPVSGPAIENGTLVVQGGKIVAIGADPKFPATPSLQVVHLGSGKHIYPGMVHANTTLGLVDVRSVRGSLDIAEVGDNNADLRSEVAFHADSVQVPVAVRGGVTAANVVIYGQLVGGTSAVMRLEGWNYEDMTVRAPIGLHLFFPEVPAAGEGEGAEAAKKKREEALKTLNDLVGDARSYQVAKGAKSPGLDANTKLEGWRGVLDGSLPLFIHADEKRQIEGALDWAKEQSIAKVVLVAGADAALVASRLAQDKVPVILHGVLELPNRTWEPYDATYSAASRLHAAGVTFCIADGDDFQGEDPALARNLAFHAGMAVAFGLPADVALRAVTLSAAEILGVGDTLGSLEVGKEASFLVTTGDPLDIRTQIEKVVIAGHDVDLSDEHQYRLYQKYKARPKPAAPAKPEAAAATKP
jgi:imidazolonepropionase-like amidohydrolase